MIKLPPSTVKEDQQELSLPSYHLCAVLVAQLVGQWRTSSMWSLPPVWYRRLSQRKVTISSRLQPHWASCSQRAASVSRYVSVMSYYCLCLLACFLNSY